jgi:hypothetical protein
VSPLQGFSPKNGIYTGLQCAVDLAERFEGVETESVVVIAIVYELMCDREGEFKRKLRGRHRDSFAVDKQKKVGWCSICVLLVKRAGSLAVP